MIVDFDVATDPNTDLILAQSRETQAASQLPAGCQQLRRHRAEIGDSRRSCWWRCTRRKGTHDAQFPGQLRVYQSERSS